MTNVYVDSYEGVASLSVQLPNETNRTGTAFHIGGGVLITSRTLVEGNKILELRIRKAGELLSFSKGSKKTQQFEGPFLHPNPAMDVAAIKIEGLKVPVLELLSTFEDLLLDEDADSMEQTVFPLGATADLDSKIIEREAKIETILNEENPYYVLSIQEKPEFIGGPCFTSFGYVLGIITPNKGFQNSKGEFGFMSVLNVEPIYECLEHYDLLCEEQFLEPF